MHYRTALALCLYPMILIAGSGPSSFQKDGVLIKAHLFRASDNKEVSSDQNSYFPDATNFFVLQQRSVQESAEMVRTAAAEHRITLDQAIFSKETDKIKVHYIFRAGKGTWPTRGMQEIETDTPMTIEFKKEGFYAILAATIIAKNRTAQ